MSDDNLDVKDCIEAFSVSRSNCFTNSSSETKKNKRLIKKWIIIIVLEILLITALLLSIFFIKNNIVTIIFGGLYFVLSVTGFFIDIKKAKTEKYKIVKICKLVSIVLFFVSIFVIGAGYTFYTEVDDDENKSPSVGTTVKTTSNSGNMSKEIINKYHFTGITTNTDFDVYFGDSENSDELFDDLVYTFCNIEYQEEYRDEILNGGAYGKKAAAAVILENNLNDLLSKNNNEINETSILKTTSDIIIGFRDEMDKIYKTSKNRNSMINDLQIAYQNNLVDDQGDTRNKCIRYAWGKLYIDIANDNYNANDINKLIELYTQYDLLSSSDHKRITLIKNSLYRLIEEFSTNPPHPIKNTK